MPFSQLIGNEPLKAAFKRMHEQNCVPQTLLFAGPEGVGKSRFALSLAALLMGPSHTHKVMTGNHPDLHIFRPEGAGFVHPVESIRQLIEEVGMPPFEASVKVFIVHDAHRMLPASSNALLKTLEEPSLGTYLVLLTHEPEMLLPTIVSRCRKIPFFPIADRLIADHAVAHWGKSETEARQIAFLAQGSMGKAHRYATHTSSGQREILYEILAGVDYPRFLKLSTQLEEKCEEEEAGGGRQKIDALFEQITTWYRDLYLLAAGGDPRYLYHSKEQLHPTTCKQFPTLEALLESVEKARLATERSIKLRVVLEELLF